jgi:hypothetical protein
MGEVGTSIGMDARRKGLPEELDRADHHHQGEESVLGDESTCYFA